MRCCRTRKRSFHFYLPHVVRRSHAAVLHVRPAAAAAAAEYLTRCYCGEYCLQSV